MVATLLGNVVRFCEAAGQTHATFQRNINIVVHKMLHTSGHPVAICCNMVVANQTTAHALAQQCCRNVAKRTPEPISPLTSGPEKQRLWAIHKTGTGDIWFRFDCAHVPEILDEIL